MKIEQHSDGHYVVTGPMEFNNITEVKEAIGGEDGASFLPNHLLNSYQYLKKLPIENLVLKTPLDSSGKGVQYLR